MIFAAPTKVLSDKATTVEYMGINKVPEWQKLFQVKLPLLTEYARYFVAVLCTEETNWSSEYF